MVACGSAHTIALCREPTRAPKAPSPPPLELHLLHSLPASALNNRLVSGHKIVLVLLNNIIIHLKIVFFF